MDISRASEQNGQSQRPVKGDPPNPNHMRGQSRSTGGVGRMISREDVHEHNKLLRHQIQALQADRDKAIQQGKGLYRKIEELRREKEEMQKRFDPKGQVSRGDHENLAKRYDQMCAQVRVLQHEKERLERVQQEKQDLENKFYDEMKSMKITLEEVERDRDNFKCKLSERNRDLDRLSEQLAFNRGGADGSQNDISRVLQERSQLRTKVNELKRENSNLQKKISLKVDKQSEKDITELKSQLSSLQQKLQSLQQERQQLAEANEEMKKRLDLANSQQQESDNEISRLNQLVSELRSTSPVRPVGRVSRGSSQEMLAMKRHRGNRGKLSQGSTDDDLGANSDLSASDNTLDLAALTRSDSSQQGSSNSSRQSIGTPSSSTSNLSPSEQLERRLSDQNSARLKTKVTTLEKQVEESRKENQHLQSKATEWEKRNSDREVQFQLTKSEMKKLQEELKVTSAKLKEAQNQISQLNKEKGVAFRDTATSYQQSIQLESQLRELQAEKQIMGQQRDIANTEREKVITESVNLKKKLELMISQRQKDAKELSAMRHVKEKAFQEMAELRKSVTTLTRTKEKHEEELSTIKDAVGRAAIKLSPRPQHKSRSGPLGASVQWSSSSSVGSVTGNGSGNTTQDLNSMVERLHVLENEKKVLLKKLFGPDVGEHGLADMLHKIETLLQERDGLLLEVEALQESSSKLNEDRIFEMKQRIEDLLMENDSLNAQAQALKREVNSLSSRLVKAEQDRDRFTVDREKMELQCQQLQNTKARLLEDHAKTLERVNELWKQKWPVNWDEAWEEKHVTVQIGPDGFAGFSVVGGRDQPQLPNPGAFLITTVNQGGPADGQLKVGDVLESINGINLTNADHRDAVRAVKETKKTLSIILRRRRHAHPIQVGIVQPIETVPHVLPSVAAATGQVEEHEYSLYITGKEKSDLGFRYGWSTVVTVDEVAPSGPATQILQPGDKIVKINNTPIGHEKPSTIKKLMKPHKNILRLVIERPQLQDRSYMGQYLPSSTTTTTSEFLLSGGGSKTPDSPPPPSTFEYERRRSQSYSGGKGSRRQSQHSQDFNGSYTDLDTEHLKASAAASMGLSNTKRLSRYQSGSRESYSSRDSRETYSQDTQSQDSASRPTKLISVVTRVKDGEKEEVSKPHSSAQTRPTSDGIMFGTFNERRIEYEDVLLSERTDSQYSQSESYLSESQCSFEYGLSSSQSFDLTFHSMTMPTHNRLTVDTVMTTQAPSQQSDDEEAVGFLARDDASRTTFRTRNASDSNSNTNNSGESDNNGSRTSDGSDSHLEDTCSTLSQDLSQSRTTERGQKFKRHFVRRRQNKSNTIHGSRSLSKLSSSDQNLSRGSSNLVLRGRSRSNLSLGKAPSMTSVMEEPRNRKSTSTTNVSQYEHDPLADAVYIRANFTYIPRNPRELSIKSGDVFHIHDEAPSERFRSSFWVSRLSADGTDEQIGAIPNSIKAQEYLEAQGESTDHAIYEEVEAYTGRRPVLIFGALSDQVVCSLLESYPNLFFSCPTECVEGAVRLTEARLKRDILERRLIDFQPTENGFEVIRVEALNAVEGKNKHCLLAGSIQALTSLKSIAPPITIFVKAMTEESITTFSPEPIKPEYAALLFREVIDMEDQHGHEFSASLFLIYMETLMKQIFDIVQKEKRKQAWVPVTRDS